MPSFDNLKQLKTVITIGSASRAQASGFQAITLVGYRTIADIELAGWVQAGTLKAKIYGMSLSDMATCTTYPLRVATQIQNTIEMYAIDGQTETLIFSGSMIKAIPVFQFSPDAYLDIQAQAAIIQSLKTVDPQSFKAPVDVVTVLNQIVTNMGMKLENNGVTATLPDTYLDNTALEQAKQICQAADIDYIIDGNIFAIMPKGGARFRNVRPIISKETGLINYPYFDGTYLSFQHLFTPTIVQGGLIEMRTETGDTQNCNGVWQVLSMSHKLESERPAGAWFTTVKCVSLDYYGK